MTLETHAGGRVPRKRLNLEGAEVILRMEEYVAIEERFRQIKELIEVAYNTADIPEKQKILRDTINLLTKHGF